MTPIRTDLPGVGSVWRDRYSPKRTVKVTGALGDSGPVVSTTLTAATGEAPVPPETNHTPLDAWDWMYEAAGLGVR